MPRSEECAHQGTLMPRLPPECVNWGELGKQRGGGKGEGRKGSDLTFKNDLITFYSRNCVKVVSYTWSGNTDTTEKDRPELAKDYPCP